jgi:hypothetical protein
MKGMHRVQVVCLLLIAMLVGCNASVAHDGGVVIYSTPGWARYTYFLLGLFVGFWGVIAVAAFFWPDKRNTPRHLATPMSTRIGFLVAGLFLLLPAIPITLMGLIRVATTPQESVAISKESVSIESDDNDGRKLAVKFDFAELSSIHNETETKGFSEKTLLVFTTHQGERVRIRSTFVIDSATPTLHDAYNLFIEKNGEPLFTVKQDELPPNFDAPPPVEDIVVAEPIEEPNQEPQLDINEFDPDKLAREQREIEIQERLAPRPVPEHRFAPPESQYSFKRYPINIPIKFGCEMVGESFIVPGIKLQSCYAGKWCYVTVQKVNEDGTIRCNWDDWASFTYEMSREDLIIETSMLESLSIAQEINSGESRSWVDNSGKFKIDAKLVKVEKGDVILSKEDGSSVSIPIAKLSTTDRRAVQLYQAHAKTKK